MKQTIGDSSGWYRELETADGKKKGLSWGCFAGRGPKGKKGISKRRGDNQRQKIGPAGISMTQPKKGGKNFNEKGITSVPTEKGGVGYGSINLEMWGSRFATIGEEGGRGRGARTSETSTQDTKRKRGHRL